MYVKANLSVEQFEIIRHSNKKNYIHVIQYCKKKKTKKDCYPNKDSYIVTVTSAEVKELMNHTTVRLLTYVKDIIETMNEEDTNTLILISK